MALTFFVCFLTCSEFVCTLRMSCISCVDLCLYIVQGKTYHSMDYPFLWSNGFHLRLLEHNWVLKRITWTMCFRHAHQLIISPLKYNISLEALTVIVFWILVGPALFHLYRFLLEINISKVFGVAEWNFTSVHFTLFTTSLIVGIIHEDELWFCRVMDCELCESFFFHFDPHFAAVVVLGRA